MSHSFFQKSHSEQPTAKASAKAVQTWWGELIIFVQRNLQLLETHCHLHNTIVIPCFFA
jgi:hypothetical protein